MWLFRLSLFGFCLASPSLESLHLCPQISGSRCPRMLFGMLGAFTLASWRILERSWDDPEVSSDSRVILS